MCLQEARTSRKSIRCSNPTVTLGFESTGGGNISEDSYPSIRRRETAVPTKTIKLTYTFFLFILIHLIEELIVNHHSIHMY